MDKYSTHLDNYHFDSMYAYKASTFFVEETD